MPTLDIKWAICPAEGASKVGSFVSLFSGRGLKIAALLDYHDGQKKMVDNLANSGLLPDGHLLKTSNFVSSEYSDIEDVIGREMYISLANAALSLPQHLALPQKRPDGAPKRVVKEVEEHCRMLPLGFPEFDHYMIADHLIALGDDDIAKIPGVDDALDRFSKLFSALNSL